jgi:hypothetical protein
MGLILALAFLRCQLLSLERVDLTQKLLKQLPAFRGKGSLDCRNPPGHGTCSSKAGAAAATCHHLIPVTAMRVAVGFAKAGIGPGRTQSTLGAVSIKAPIKAMAFETMVAETAMADLYGPALRCSVAAEPAVVRLDPGDSEGVVVRRDPMACETGAAKTANMASAAKTKTTDGASAAKTKTTDVASAAKTKTTDVASAAKTKTTDMASAAKTKTTDMASAAQATAPCERDCAGRCCRYAEHDGRTCCNQLLTHFSELLMFHLIWIASVQPLCSCCCDWFTIAPIWKDRQNQEVVQDMPLRAIARSSIG